MSLRFIFLFFKSSNKFRQSSLFHTLNFSQFPFPFPFPFPIFFFYTFKLHLKERNCDRKTHLLSSFALSNPIIFTMVRARKLAVVGSRSVGKSSMIVRFVEDYFVESYYPTIENQFSKNVVYKNHEYEIEILDTAGQDEFSMINEKHLVGIHGYLLVYSVTSRQSFEVVEIIRDKILNSIGSDNIPMTLVGNKADLNFQRQVETSEGQELAKSFNCKFLETSVKDDVNINKSFELLIDEIETIHNPDVKAEGKCVIV